jgi:hypothetical protein
VAATEVGVVGVVARSDEAVVALVVSPAVCARHGSACDENDDTVDGPRRGDFASCAGRLDSAIGTGIGRVVVAEPEAEVIVVVDPGRSASSRRCGDGGRQVAQGAGVLRLPLRRAGEVALGVDLGVLAAELPPEGW